MDENKRKRKLVISGSERYEKRNDDSDSAGCVCQYLIILFMYYLIADYYF